LKNHGCEVHGTCRPGHPIPGDVDAFVHSVELTAVNEVRNIIRDLRPQAVIHLAGISFAAHDDIEEIYLSNILATRFLLQSLSESAGEVEHVIVASSANVYGNQNAEVLVEDMPLRPANDYGVSKVATELVCEIFSDKLPVTIVRPFNYTGVGQSTSFLIPKIVDHFRNERDFIELGNINVMRDFSDVRDVSENYFKLMNNHRAFGATVNICSGAATSLRQVIDICTEITGHQLQVRVNPSFVRRNEVISLLGSTDRLTRIVGQQDRIPLRATLNWMLGR
jgi:GDP-6-deoxy-D-talose 4-dehydrogenase